MSGIDKGKKKRWRTEEQMGDTEHWCRSKRVSCSKFALSWVWIKVLTFLSSLRSASHFSQRVTLCNSVVMPKIQKVKRSFVFRNDIIRLYISLLKWWCRKCMISLYYPLTSRFFINRFMFFFMSLHELLSRCCFVW